MGARQIDRLIGALAMASAGVFSRRSVLEAGGDDTLIWRRVRAERWERVAPGVFRLAAAPASYRQRLWIARLTVDVFAVVSHEAAAALHGLAGFPEGPVVLITPHGSHPRAAGAVVHQTRDPWMVSSEVIDGLLVTTPERTFVDLAGLPTIRRLRLSVSLDDALARRKMRHGDVERELFAVARSGKPGVRLLTTVLDELRGEAPKQSDLEREHFALYDRFGGPRPKPQWPYPGRDQFNGCADAGFPDALLAIETDGRAWHTRVQDLKRDHHRDAEAARAGVQVLRILYEDVKRAPRETWDLIQETRRTRLRQLGRAAPAPPPILEAIPGGIRKVLPPESVSLDSRG